MLYLHLFDTNSNFEQEYYGEKYHEPWVSFTEQDKLVHYNKKLRDYLRFDVLSNGVIKWKSSDGNFTRTIEYSKNGGRWTEITSTTAGAEIEVSDGDIVYFRGENQQYAEVIDPNAADVYGSSNIRTVSFNGTTCNFNVSGNIMSLIKKDRAVFRRLKKLDGDCNFYGMFRIGNNLKSIEDLVLPATDITNGCYGFMFTSAGTVNSIVILPARNMKMSCYRNIFSDCASLTSVPVLNNVDTDDHCFAAMFARCSSLQAVPSNYLPSTVAYAECYTGMFRLCTSLTAVPELPATTLMNGCYSKMFISCTSLAAGPTTLPAKQLVNDCYYHMFEGCTNLVSAPIISAETGGTIDWAMEAMFSGCTKVDSLVCLITDFAGSASTNLWLNGVKSTGTFYKSPNASTSSITERIPSGWSVVDYNPGN